nr:alcohol acetyltransferase [Actinomycetales bacterium]
MIEQAPQAQRPGWVRLDNAANIFVAARSEVDTKVFRLSAELDEDIDSAVLQQALDRVYAQYPLFRAVLRRGIFWYYLQQSELQPEVRFDDGPSVPHLYQDERRDLLFRVLHRGRRISLEVFHALTDGTG